MQLTSRYFCAHPSDVSMPGVTYDEVDLDPRQTAFIELHCWNVGFSDGPPPPREYWVDMGSIENHEIGSEIVYNRIKPALDASRAAGLTVFHVQPPNIAEKHPQSRYMLEPQTPPSPKPEAIPGYRKARAEKVHGPGYMDWEGWKALDVPKVVYPQPDENVIVTGAQFDRILREKGILNLIYTGFATNLCILDSAAAMKEMASYGYRCILIRDCTMAVEFQDTVKDLLNTKVATRYIEAWVGSTIALSEYLAACRDLQRSATLETR
jgi:nicotinamidase-related amidase